MDELIEEITVDAYGDDEQLWAFRQVCEDNLALPADAFVIGESISVLEIDYDGNERRGLIATCRRVDGSEQSVPDSNNDLEFQVSAREKTEIMASPFPYT